MFIFFSVSKTIHPVVYLISGGDGPTALAGVRDRVGFSLHLEEKTSTFDSTFTGLPWCHFRVLKVGRIYGEFTAILHFFQLSAI
jgi:hypothetical protein